MPSITGGHHIALTVTDADRSAEWYSGLLGMSVLAAGDDETVKVRVLVDAASGWLLGEKLIAKRAALVDAKVGQGHVVLFGFRPQYRAQSYQAFKLLFNAFVM